MPFKNESTWNETAYSGLTPLETFFEFSSEDDTLIITKKVWNQEKREYDDAFVVKLDVTVLANLGERFDKIDEEMGRLWAAFQGNAEVAESE